MTDGDERSLRERMEEDLKTAMRAGDAVAKETIRFTLAQVKNAEIEKGGKLSAEEDVALIRRQGKRLNEAIEQFRAANRPDLVEKEAAQLEVLNRYLPAAMDDAALRRIVEEAVRESGATSPREMGKVMPKAMAEVKGQADGGRVSAMVKQVLGAGG